MLSFWRRRTAARRGGKNHDGNGNSVTELTVPINFRCPISLDLMKDPVTLSTGITYDRESIEKWIESGSHTCPITNQLLQNLEPTPNHAIRKMIQDWCVENSSYGVERIPTPRIPISSFETSEILVKVVVASQTGDGGGCLELVVKIKDLVSESDRNKRRLVASGAGRALSEAFEAFSERSTGSSLPMQCQQHDYFSRLVSFKILRDCQYNMTEEEKDLKEENLLPLEGYFGKNSALLGEILSTLTLLFPLDDEEAKSRLGSFSSLNSMVRFFKYGDLSQRSNAVLVMNEIVSSNPEKTDDLAKIEGAMEALVKLVKEPICTKTTRATLMIVYKMVASMSSPLQNEVQERFVEMGLVSLLLETLVESTERGISERALGILDGICSCREGRERAYCHALTIPVLVKKILRVSDLATGFSVSILWKLLSKRESMDEEREGGGGGGVGEALQMGAFQKLLLVLQVGCCEDTREKASELLKLMNLCRNRVECVDSMDFKDLKRPF